MKRSSEAWTGRVRGLFGIDAQSISLPSASAGQRNPRQLRGLGLLVAVLAGCAGGERADDGGPTAPGPMSPATPSTTAQTPTSVQPTATDTPEQTLPTAVDGTVVPTTTPGPPVTDGEPGATAAPPVATDTPVMTVPAGMVDAGCGSHKWACWPMPNLPGSGLPNQASYTSNDDGTLVDDVTGLVWQSEQSDQTYDWQGAIDYCDGLVLGGQDDWRAPTRIEVMSVLDYTDANSGWSEDAFPDASGGFHHTGSDWILTITQTGAGAGTDFAWAFNMSDGILSNAYSKANLTPARCVRSDGMGEAASEPAVAPPNQYTLLTQDEAQDNYTGLIWQRGDSDAMLSWEEAITYCDTLALNGNAWRVPTIRELSTLVDEAEVAPSINAEMFPDTQFGARSNNWYWASHQKSGASWGINFDDGFTGFNIASAAWNTFGPAWARCVR